MFFFTQTDHVMLTDRGASMFAERIGIPVADDLVTELERKDWEQSSSFPVGVEKFFNTQWWVILSILCFEMFLIVPVLLTYFISDTDFDDCTVEVNCQQHLWKDMFFVFLQGKYLVLLE